LSRINERRWVPACAGTTWKKFTVLNCRINILRDSLKLRDFVNADTVADGLSGFAPETVAFGAGRIVLKRIDALIDQRSSSPSRPHFQASRLRGY
jgi:predicted ABC-type ATPase